MSQARRSSPLIERDYSPIPTLTIADDGTSTATEQPTLPAWEPDAGRFSLAPGAEPHLCNVDYPIVHGTGTPGTTTEPEMDLPSAMEMPTVLLSISPLAGFDRLRKTVRDDLRHLLDELDDYLMALGIAAATEPPAREAPHTEPVARKRRWHR